MRYTKKQKHVKPKKNAIKSRKHIKLQKNISRKHIKSQIRHKKHRSSQGQGIVLFTIPEKKTEQTILLNQNGQGQQDISMIPGLRNSSRAKQS